MTAPIDNAAMVAARIEDAIRALRTTIDGLELLGRLVQPQATPEQVEVKHIGGRDDLRPETLALIERLEAAMPSQKTPEFTRLRESVFNVQACTSLSDEEATERVNRLAAGTINGWHLTTEPHLAPVPCEDQPDTHRHVVFEC